MTEPFRLADQIRRAFEGNAWHGDSVVELLAGVDAKTAAARPIKNAHSIWEILLHIAAWDDVIVRRIGGRHHRPYRSGELSRGKRPQRRGLEPGD
jgi:uncharacterized damage-inducible protein DinB